MRTLFTVQEVLEVTGGRMVFGQSVGCLRLRIRRVSTDSRDIKQGDLFVPLSGERYDGSQFIGPALRAGARGALVEMDSANSKAGDPALAGYVVGKAGRAFCIGVPDTLRALQELAAYHRNRFSIPVVAVTGSNGKTTTKEMTAQVLAQRWKTLKTESNFNNRIGVPKTLLRLTPHHQAAVVEMGVDHLGQTTRLCQIANPTVGLITNIGPDHLEFFKSLDGSAQAKAELIDWMSEKGSVVLNADDPFFEELASRATCKVLSFGFSPKAQIRGEILSSGLTGPHTVFRLILPGRTRHPVVRLHVHGIHNVSNALGAAAVGYVLGVNGAMIVRGLEAFRPAAMRSQIIVRGGVHFINDCYNANPASMKAAVDVLADLRRTGRAVAVLGDMLELGEETETFHREVGMYIAKAKISLLLAVGRLGRRIAEGALAGQMDANRVLSARDVPEAKKLLKRFVQSGDVVLIKASRGMRMEEMLEAFS